MNLEFPNAWPGLMNTSQRPDLNTREEALLKALKLMRGWVIHHTEPSLSGSGAPHAALQRDMAIASGAIFEATGGNEE